MIVFASTMAQMNDLDWKVVNLVSRTQWKKGALDAEKDTILKIQESSFPKQCGTISSSYLGRSFTTQF